MNYDIFINDVLWKTFTYDGLRTLSVIFADIRKNRPEDQEFTLSNVKVVPRAL